MEEVDLIGLWFYVRVFQQPQLFAVTQNALTLNVRGCRESLGTPIRRQSLAIQGANRAQAGILQRRVSRIRETDTYYARRDACRP